MYLLGGPWTPEAHIEHFSFDVGMAAAIAEHLKPEWALGWATAGVVDWGCGLGCYMAPLDALGARCIGVEPIPMGEHFRGGAQLLADISRPLPLGPVHLTLCLEVMEHVDAAGHGAAFDNIARTTGGWLVFSAATPGQGGQGHIAERPEEYWCAALQTRGLAFMPALTADFREAALLPWFKANVMVWCRG